MQLLPDRPLSLVKQDLKKREKKKGKVSVCRSSCLQSVLKSLPSPRFLNLPEEGTVTPGKETGATSEGPSDHTLTSMGKKSKYKALKELVPTNLFNFVYPSPKKHGTISLHPLPLPSPDLHEKFPVRCHNSGVCSAPPLHVSAGHGYKQLPVSDRARDAQRFG